MSGLGQCSICLGEYDEPVCIPCGHVYCLGCITDVVNRPEERGSTARCPTCRTEFHLVVPDLTYLPSKYHPFVVSPLRRIYMDASNQPTRSSNAVASSSTAIPTSSSAVAAAAAALRAKEQEQERVALSQLEAEVARHKARVARHKENEEVLQQQCARHQAKAMGYREKENKAQNEVRKMRKLYEEMMERLERAEKEKEILERLWERRERRDGERVAFLEKEVERLMKENEGLEMRCAAASAGVPMMNLQSGTISAPTPPRPILKASKKVRVQQPEPIDIDLDSGPNPSASQVHTKNHHRMSSQDSISLLASMIPSQTRSISAPQQLTSASPPSSMTPESASAFTSGSRTTPSSPTRVVRPLPRRTSTNSLYPSSPLLPLPVQPKRARVSSGGVANSAGQYTNSNLAYYKARANEVYSRKMAGAGLQQQAEEGTEVWLVDMERA